MTLDTHTKNPTRSASIYDRMRGDILNGRLKAGDKLGMAHLQDMYAVGNSPIREALNRLLPEGLVMLEHQKGFRVQPLSKDDLREITKMRCWLEDLAIRECIKYGDAQWEESIVLAKHRLSREQRFADDKSTESNPFWEQQHEEFHLALLSACRSKWLTSYCKNMIALNERYRRNGLDVNYTPRDAQQEHTDIVEAIFAKDADKASELLQRHCHMTTNSILESLPD